MASDDDDVEVLGVGQGRRSASASTMGLRQRLGAIRLNRDQKIDTPMFDARVAIMAQTRSFKPMTSAAWSSWSTTMGTPRARAARAKAASAKASEARARAARARATEAWSKATSRRA